MRPPRETDVLITDSREGLFLIRLLGLRSSPQPDSLSGGLKKATKKKKKEAEENVKSESETWGIIMHIKTDCVRSMSKI